MPNTIISRRTALIGTTAIGLGATAGIRVPASEAHAPIVNSQAPYFYRFMVDKFQATVVSDGPLPLGEPSATMKGQTKEELAKALADNFLPTDRLILEQNALILNTGSKLVLFDTGMGTAKAFGPTTGRLLKSLEEAKISPSAIDDVICSHGHIDHIGGLADAKGKRYFPNANVWITKADYDFWTDESKLSGDLKLFVQHARQNLMPYKDRTKWIEDGKDVVPGVQAMVSPGHTVGHSIFIIKSGRQGARRHGRHDASPDHPHREAAHRVLLRHGPQAGRDLPPQGVRHGGVAEDPAARLSLPMAGLRLSRQAG